MQVALLLPHARGRDGGDDEGALDGGAALTLTIGVKQQAVACALCDAVVALLLCVVAGYSCCATEVRLAHACFLALARWTACFEWVGHGCSR